jgi:hypothetical protein
MRHQGTLAVSGHVFCVKRKRGPQWYVKYRVGTNQIQKRLGPAWQDSGEPPPGYFTRKTAEAALAAILTDARRGTVPHSTASGATVRQAAEEWLRHSEWGRGVRASTLSEYRSVVEAHIEPRFGDQSIETVTARQVEAWAAELLASGRSRRTVNKILTMLHGVLSVLGESGTSPRTRSPTSRGRMSVQSHNLPISQSMWRGTSSSPTATSSSGSHPISTQSRKARRRSPGAWPPRGRL